MQSHGIVLPARSFRKFSPFTRRCTGIRSCRAALELVQPLYSFTQPHSGRQYTSSQEQLNEDDVRGSFGDGCHDCACRLFEDVKQRLRKQFGFCQSSTGSYFCAEHETNVTRCDVELGRCPGNAVIHLDQVFRRDCSIAGTQHSLDFMGPAV